MARAAVAEERARIAREIHDVLAHSVTVMVVNAEGAKHAKARDPAVVDRTLDMIGATGRAALTDLRRLLAVLHSDRDSPAGDRDPQPTIDDLADLVARCANGRAAIELDTIGDARSLPPAAALQVYRIVQEALTNVVKHAAPDASARVSVDFGRPQGERTVRIEVCNAAGSAGPAALPSSGRGLAGIRERAAMFAGEVSAGPLPEGGYRVRVSLVLAAHENDGGPHRASDDDVARDAVTTR
nr:histidine kinase [Streptomyces sp. SID3343]